MNHKEISRREFLKAGLGIAAGVAAASPLSLASCATATPPSQEGTKTAVAEFSHMTTKPPIIKTLAKLMKAAGKEVLVGEGSASAQGFNSIDGEDYRTKNREILDAMQQHVFDRLGYTDLTKEMDIPLLNLHSGEMAPVSLPDGFAFKELTLHRALTEIDLLCSVPMMKTHTLAQVTLGMKNLFGLFPGTVYGSVRGHVHDITSDVEPSGTAAAIVDMVRANRLGLVVVDGVMAMGGSDTDCLIKRHLGCGYRAPTSR